MDANNTYEFKTKPFQHQLEALKRSWKRRNFAYFMEMGCVDGDTEFLTQRGWVRFADFDLNKWERPLLVAQAVPTKDPQCWGYEFVEPEAFIRKPCENWVSLISRNFAKGKMYEILTTEDHTFPIVNYNWREDSSYATDRFYPALTSDYMASVFLKDKELPELPDGLPQVKVTDKVGLKLPQVCTEGLYGFKSEYYTPENPDIAGLTPWEVRFMVAVMADGTFPNKYDNKCDFYFIKDRKAERLRYLAAMAGIPLVYKKTRRTYREKGPSGEPENVEKDVHVFHCVPPLRYKQFTSEWYALNQEQLRCVAEEVFYWDGTVWNKNYKFDTTIYETAEFVQYALFSIGWSSRISYNASQKLYSVVGSISKCYADLDLPHRVEVEGVVRKELPIERFIVGASRDYTKRMSYCFRVPSSYLILRREDSIFISGNSGKTKVMIDNIGMLHSDRSITGAIIFAPKGVYRNWSSKEIPTHLPDSIQRDVIVWNAAATARAKQRMMDRIKNWDSRGRTLQILVFNIESLISDKGQKLIDAFIKRHSGNVFALVDESTCIKNHKAKRTKKAIAVAKDCKVRRIATGSPITNSPLDVFSQCAFLDTDLLGYGSYYSFRNTFANIEKIQNRQGQHYEKILSYKNLDILSEKLDKFSYRVTKKECLDLPDKIYTTRDVELTEEQLKVYKEMQSYAFAILQDGEHFSEMSAQVVLTKFLRLHQILCGSFTSDDGTVHRIKNNRLSSLQEVLDETSGKVIIWATYLADIEAITEMLEQVYGPDSFVTYYGATSSDDRVKAIEKFQDENSSVRFFIGNVQTAGRGITLTAANTVVYYSNNFSLELRQQSEDRAHRLGQKNPVTYVDLVVRGSLDEKIIKSLIEKRNIANEILKDDLDEWISISQE